VQIRNLRKCYGKESCKWHNKVKEISKIKRPVVHYLGACVS
jgi:hypothetical protein